ncbi:hypothetical protein B5E48_04865 [Massilimicrobiota sp. An105]|uniref:glycosyltransferase family 2 protein n=1 Tax=Massilimicrobiota sp. An105 TaxID=1965540 RepID=UPI000B391BB2|nr:glycosyltransferase family 2 protein [Massilimicrobiota sp. An105]OUQ80715.1 hypothetical protein B5E48_04865 [Massilimicrobiota sp. An105]
MKSNYLVSIVVPIYNVEKYLERCLNSLINQTYKNIEILLINDGSTDESESICLKYIKKDSRIKYYKKENGGLSSARNKGIAVSMGKYISFIDSDDYVRNDMIETLLYYMVKNDADIVECNYYEVRINGKITEKKKNYEIKSYNSGEAIKSLIDNESITPTAWNKLYNRQLFNKIKYTENIFHEDEDIIIKLLIESKKIVSIPDCLYFYITRNGSIINSPLKLNHFDIIKIMQDRIQLLKNEGVASELIDKTNARLSNIYNELYARILLSLDGKFDKKLEYIKNKRHKQIKMVLLSSIKLNRKIRCLIFYLMPKISYKITIRRR